MDSEAVPGRLIELASVPNLRDLGGYATRDGGRVRMGGLYRSTELGRLADEEWRRSGGSGSGPCSTCARRPSAQAAPTACPTATAPRRMRRPRRLAADGARPQLQSLVTDPSVAERVLGDGRAAELFEQAYRDIVSLPSALAAYRRMFTAILDGDRRPALFHCTTGKDRTGWGAAAPLTLLGVSEEDVRADYMTTNRDLLPALQPYFDRFAEAGGGPGAATAVSASRPLPAHRPRRDAQPLRDGRARLRARPRHRRRRPARPARDLRRVVVRRRRPVRSQGRGPRRCRRSCAPGP